MAVLTAMVNQAQEPPAGSINDLAVRIAMTNPDVWSAGISGRAAAEEVLASNVLPDPVVEFEHLWGSPGTKLTAAVSQELQLPTLFSARERLATSYTDAGRNKVWAQWSEKALEAKLVILDIIHVRRCVSELNGLLANLDTLEMHAARAVAGGEMTVLDRRKVGIEKVGVRQKIAEFESQLPALYGQLSALGDGRDYTQMVDGLTEYPAEPMLTLDQYLAESQRDYRYRQNTLDSDVIDASLALSRAERLPTLSLGYVFNREEGVNFNGLNLSMTLPIYSNRHRRAAIEVQREQLEADGQALSVEVQSGVRALYAEADVLKAQIAELSPLVNDTETQSLLMRALDTKVITVLDYIANINYFTDARLMLMDAQYRYTCALARLNRYSLSDLIEAQN